MARGNTRASSELKGFATYKTGGYRGFDPDSDDEMDADREARAMGYSNWKSYERDQPDFDSEVKWHMGSDSLKGYLKGGDQLKDDLAKLTPEETKTYKQYRKVAVDAFNEAEEKAKTEWQAANPGKEYEGRTRISFVSAGLRAAAVAVAEKFGEKDYESREKAPKSETLGTKYSSLALARLTFEKDAFLRVKGHYEHPTSKSIPTGGGKTLKYLHIDNPWTRGTKYDFDYGNED